MDRQALLVALRHEPQDDVLRLAYADWLEEHASNEPNAAATIEFIRISCPLRKPSGRMPLPAYRWLDDNWHRLVPATMALHDPWEPDQQIRVSGHSRINVPENETDRSVWRVSGRNVWMRINLPAPYRGNWNRRVAVPLVLEMWKGFCVSAIMYSTWAMSVVMPVLREEQPLLKISPLRPQTT